MPFPRLAAERVQSARASLQKEYFCSNQDLLRFSKKAVFVLEMLFNLYAELLNSNLDKKCLLKDQMDFSCAVGLLMLV